MCDNINKKMHCLRLVISFIAVRISIFFFGQALQYANQHNHKQLNT